MIPTVQHIIPWHSVPHNNNTTAQRTALQNSSSQTHPDFEDACFGNAFNEAVGSDQASWFQISSLLKAQFRTIGLLKLEGL